MEVSTASSRDVGDLIALRDELARWLTARGIDQWRPGELPKDWIEHEVAQGFVHVVRDAGNLVATAAMAPGSSASPCLVHWNVTNAQGKKQGG